MKIEQKYQEGLKRLIKEKHLDEINVVMLCEAVKSNRQTFYYHYRDISDVVDSIFLKEKIGQGKIMYDFEANLKAMIAYLNSNYSFVSAINNSFASDKFFSFLYSYFYNKISSICKNEGKDPYAHRTIIRYLSNIYSSELQTWIRNKRKEHQETLMKRFLVIYNYFTTQYSIDLRKEATK